MKNLKLTSYATLVEIKHPMFKHLIVCDPSHEIVPEIAFREISEILKRLSVPKQIILFDNLVSNKEINAKNRTYVWLEWNGTEFHPRCFTITIEKRYSWQFNRKIKQALKN